MRGPVDPRLWRRSASTRRYLLLSVALSTATTVAMVATALLVARVLAGIITEPERRSVEAWSAELTTLVVAVVVRAGTTWWQARIAQRVGATVVAELGGEVLAAGTRLPVRELDSRRGELAVVATTGLAGLRPYLGGYLPALLLAVIVPPTVLVVIVSRDPVSAAIVAVTLPLIPVFMILIGRMSKGRADAALRSMTRLADQMLDLFAGLPTLRALGREWGPQRRVAELGAAHRRNTMATLRVAFLSAMVLELLATLCVALVAVSIGMRLVFGHMQLEAGLVALILAPEVYLPLRLVGERFHAAEDGMAAAGKAFDVIEAAAADSAQAAGRPLPAGPIAIELTGITVSGRDGASPADLDVSLRPGLVTVLTGPNGCGKSTALHVILGLMSPSSGTVQVAGGGLDTFDRQAWWARVAWLPQRPALIPGTLRDNVELFGAVPGSPALAQACVATGFDAVVADLTDGWDTVVGNAGVGLSLGQRQRLALTRVLAADKSVLLLDEPTAHLDSESEATVLESLIRRARAGATVVVVGHRPSVLATGDVVVRVGSRVVV